MDEPDQRGFQGYGPGSFSKAPVASAISRPGGLDAVDGVARLPEAAARKGLANAKIGRDSCFCRARSTSLLEVE